MEPSSFEGYRRSIEVHNGWQVEKSEAEKAAAGELMGAVVEGTLRSYVADVRHEMVPPYYDRLVLERQKQDEDNYLQVTIHAKRGSFEQDDGLSPEERVVSEIELYEIRDGDNREMLTYLLMADGVVRRLNGGDFAARAEGIVRELDSSLPWGVASIHDVAEEVREEAEQIIVEIEEYLRYQRQPVGVEEVERLVGLLAEEQAK